MCDNIFKILQMPNSLFVVVQTGPKRKGKAPSLVVKGHKPMHIHNFCSRTKFSDYVAKYQMNH